MIKPIICIIFCIFISFFSSSVHPTMAITHEAKTIITTKLNDLIRQHPYLKGAIVGASIRDASNGELIYTYNGDTRLTPASNLKLFTAAAALTTLGANYTFQTDILTDGTVKWNVLSGNLYLKGKGDPTLLPDDFNKFAKQLKKKGIKIISGDLIGDDSWYDDVRYSIDVPWSDETANYGAQTSALTASPDSDFDCGTIIVEVAPADATNKKANITLNPKTEYIEVINQTNTVDSKEKNDITIIREHGKNTIKIEGTIPLNAPTQKEWVAVWDPTRYALSLFKQGLKNQGIKVLGNERVADSPKDANLLFSHSSISLSELLVPFLKLSNNGHGEILIKEMGKVYKGKGSWVDGLDVEKTALSMIGVQTETMEIRDGSGISHANLVTANEITNLLYRSSKMAWFPLYFSSLPIGGEKEKMIGGTLRNRMKTPPLKGNVIAKTGTLTNVSSLSGYVITKSGETLLFSILLNHLTHDAEGKLIEDEIVSIIANS